MEKRLTSEIYVLQDFTTASIILIEIANEDEDVCFEVLNKTCQP
jgi:hypothetical protein